MLAVKRVNELDFYSLGLKDLAKKLGIGINRALAVVRHLDLQSDEECFKDFKVGSQAFKRYSPKALDLAKKALPEMDMDAVWEKYKPKGRRA